MLHLVPVATTGGNFESPFLWLGLLMGAVHVQVSHAVPLGPYNVAV